MFSDPRVIALLKGFVPVALNTFDTQHRKRKDALRTYFYSIVDAANLYQDVPKIYASGRYGGPRPYHVRKSPKGTTQGFYGVDASGKVYFSRWGLFANYGPENLLPHLRKALAAHGEPLPDASVAKAKAVDPLPAKVEVVNVFARVSALPGQTLKGDAAEASERLGRDALWILPAEIEALAEARFPETLRWRLTSLHLLDTTPGVPSGWDPAHVRKARYSAALRLIDGQLRIAISGEFDLADGRERGFRGRLQGEIICDPKTRKVRSLRMLARGTAWTRSDRFQLKIGFVRAVSRADRSVQPMVLGYNPEVRGWYLASTFASDR